MKTFVLLLVASATILYQLTSVFVLAFSLPHSKAISHSPPRRTTASSATILYESKATLTSSSADRQSSSTSSTTTTTRPLHQNWFPVSITTALRPDRPNAIQLLSQKLVLYQDSDDTWVCLADRCSHRFAPLSEGRLISSRSSESNSSSSGGGSVDDKSSCASCSSIQCAYHGWQFDSTGKCITVPQSPSSSATSTKAKPIPTFPCREEAGMIWVWGDSNPTTFDVAKSIPLPISPLVRRAYSNFGADACFMRDLPYGMELLGENLLDLSHLPFSHHNVGGLSRELGGELVLRMMSEKERVAYALWEEEFVDDDNGVGGEDKQDVMMKKKKRYSVPIHQAEVMNARHTDPMFLSMAKRFPVSENANSTISFYEPCHIRYRRERVPGTFGHVELFMCPTSAGKSRVFLWNTIYKPPEETVSTAAASLKSRLAKLSPLSAIKRAMLAKLFNPATSRAHLLSHSIFDGDGIFLNYQGNRMYENGLTFRDYSTPSSADVLLNAYRRYLDSAAKLSTKAAAKAVSYQSNDAYGDDDITRAMMLDRYNSHTKHCAVCQKELGRYEKKRGVVATLKTALVGAGGASAAALIGALFVGLPVAVARAAAISSVTSTLGFTALSRKETALERKIQSFKFEDYIHAEKN
ncbi:hypothetical protein ACHAWC_008591 [Mediolabrus comicus]